MPPIKPRIQFSLEPQATTVGSLDPTDAQLDAMTWESMERLASRQASHELKTRVSSTDELLVKTQKEAALNLEAARQRDYHFHSILSHHVDTTGPRVTSTELEKLLSSSDGGDSRRK